MNKILIISKKKWSKKNYKYLNKKKFIYYKNLNFKTIKKIKPKIIFFIHWSKKIERKIFKNFLCIQFHCSDLPKFRGGSPVQNQILKGLKKTKLTAFKVTNKLDTGDYCFKRNLSLNGSGSEIYKRLEKKAIHIIKILSKKKYIKFYKQKGLPTYYKRRIEKESYMRYYEFKKLENVYNFIRMLDAQDYPKAFLKLNNFKISFMKAKKSKKKIIGEYIIEK